MNNFVTNKAKLPQDGAQVFNIRGDRSPLNDGDLISLDLSSQSYFAKQMRRQECVYLKTIVLSV